MQQLGIGILFLLSNQNQFRFLPWNWESKYTLKTGIPVEEGDSILKLLWKVFHPEIQLGLGFYSELDFIFNC